MPETVRLTFLGDIHFGEDPAFSIDARLREVLGAADLVVANLESPLTDRATCVPHKAALRSSAGASRLLVEWGIPAASIANNHIFDCGLEGYEDTVRELDERGIAHTGAGANLLEAERPLIVERGGMRIALLACAEEQTQATMAAADSYGCAPCVVPRLCDRIREARASADVVIVLPHWGYCGYGIPIPRQLGEAKTLLDAGATAVIGHHSHAFQGIYEGDGVLVAYSLGNFAFGGFMHNGRFVPPSREGLHGLILNLEVSADGVRSWTALHTVQRQGTICIDESPKRHQILVRKSHELDEEVLEKLWKRAAFCRLLRRAVFWLNPMRWRKIGRQQLRGAAFMIRKAAGNGE